jgi:hypothetical protein
MNYYKHSLAIAVTCLISFYAKSQKLKSDTDYYETYPDKITGRIYISQKYVHVNFPGANDNVKELEYKANAKMNLGIGITIRKISANIFYGFSFLNNKDSAKGKTKGLDLQLHIYPGNWAIDLLAVFPKGLYLDPKGFASPDPSKYYYRPDVQTALVGLSGYYVQNKERFSYRAAVVNTEWQKKSAGSLLFGGGIYHGIIKGDSSLVPVAVQNNYPQAGISKINFFSIGPGLGYAYTIVVARHLFLTGSMIGNLNLSFSSEHGTAKTSKTSLNPATVFKAGTGYNSSTWSVGINWTGNGLWFKGASSPENYFWPNGNFKVLLSRKFEVKKHHTTT